MECGEIVTPKNIVHCIQPVVLTEVMFWTDKDFLDPCDELTNVSQERVVAWIQDRMIPNSEAVAAWRGEILKAIRGQLQYQSGMTPRNAYTRLNARIHFAIRENGFDLVKSPTTGVPLITTTELWKLIRLEFPEQHRDHLNDIWRASKIETILGGWLVVQSVLNSLYI